MNTSKVLKGLRGKKTLSQENVAEMLGMTRQSYNTFENDLLNSDCMVMFKVLEVLKANDIEIKEFFDALRQDYLSYQDKESEA